MQKIVNSVAELLAATSAGDVDEIVLANSLRNVPGLRLGPNQALRSAIGDNQSLVFNTDADGVCCTQNNRISDIVLRAHPAKRAIWNDTSEGGLGRICIERVTTSGRVQIIANEKNYGGHIDVKGLHIGEADARGEMERPCAYGVEVLQGAFTLWNMNPSETAILTADLRNLSVGRRDQPVRGTGILLCGCKGDAKSLRVGHLSTGPVYSHGGIDPGVAGVISGGVFVLYGAFVNLVENLAPVLTFGVNDMALDNWGTVDRWFAHDAVTTFGASAIGFVSFGELGYLRAFAPIETFGPGARGFNVYAGTVKRAEFDRIVTRGDGAVGVQISQPIGSLIVHRGIETFGSTGPSLVKGVIEILSAVALSIKPGGYADEVQIDGGLATHGQGISALEQNGRVIRFAVRDGFFGAS